MISYEVGKEISIPDTPTKEGYVFVNWYLTKTSDEVFDLKDVKGSITVYARYREDTNTGGVDNTEVSEEEWEERLVLINGTSIFSNALNMELDVTLTDNVEDTSTTVKYDVSANKSLVFFTSYVFENKLFYYDSFADKHYSNEIIRLYKQNGSSEGCIVFNGWHFDEYEIAEYYSTEFASLITLVGNNFAAFTFDSTSNKYTGTINRIELFEEIYTNVDVTVKFSNDSIELSFANYLIDTIVIKNEGTVSLNLPFINSP